MADSVPHQEERTNSSRSLLAWRSGLILSRNRATRSTHRHGRRPPRDRGRAGAARQMNHLSQSLCQEAGCESPAKIHREHHHRAQALCGPRRPGARPRRARSTSQQNSASATHTIQPLIPCRRAFPVTATSPGGPVSLALSRVYLVLSSPLLTRNGRIHRVYLGYLEGA